MANEVKDVERVLSKAREYDKMADEMRAIGDVHAERYARNRAQSYREDAEAILARKGGEHE